jgi:single-strand DNA-binding protein
MAPSDKEEHHERIESAMSPISINRVVLTGSLTSDPDLRTLPSGLSVCDLRIAVSARRRDPVTGEWGERPNYFDVVVFGGHGETVAKYMQKGRRIAIDGRLHWREWETKDGRQAQAVKVIAETVQFMGSPPGESYGAAGNSQGVPESITGGEEESLNSADGEELQRMDEEALAAGLESPDEDPQTMEEEALAASLESPDENPQTMEEEALAMGPLIDYREQ